MEKVTHLLLVCCLAFATAHGATYYVDYSAGNDANAGTSTGAAWKHAPGDTNATGTASSTTLNAGDSVLFKGGVVYSNQIHLTRSGSPTHRITYAAADGWGSGKAVIDRNYTSNTVAFSLASGVSHIKIAHFELRNCGGFAEDSTVVSNAAAGVYGNTTNAWRVQMPGWGIDAFNGPVTNLYLDGLYIHHMGIWYSSTGWDGRSICGIGIRFQTVCDTVITNCEFTKIGLTAVQVLSTGVSQSNTITDCYIHDHMTTWGLDIAPYAVNAVLNNFTITKTRLVNLWSEWDGTPDDPLGTGTTAPHQNYIMLRTGGTVCTFTNIYVTRCYFTETNDTHIGSGGTAAIFITQGPSVNVWNNVFARSWNYSGTIYIIYGLTSSDQRVTIFNNTFFRKQATPIMVAYASAILPRTLEIANNIIVNQTGVAANNSMVVFNDTYDYPELCNYNLYYGYGWGTNQMYVSKQGAAGKLWPQHQALGWDTNGFYADPLFIDHTNAVPVNRNFSIRSNSPAIGVGTNLSAYFTVDYNGVARGTAWDIGAYEYSEEETPPLGPGGGSGARVTGNVRAGSLRRQ